MALVSGKMRDPKLEAIRNSVITPSNEAELIRYEELLRKTKDIHVSFLFGPEGKRLHDELCLSLSSTQQTPLYSGWEDFGGRLGINPQVIRYLGLGLTREDPTYNIFRAFAYKEHATLGNVVEALRLIKRPDVIVKNYDLFNELANEVHRKYRTSEESGYFSQSEGNVESSNGCSEDDIQRNIIKSPYNSSMGPNILKSHSIEMPERCTQINIQAHHAKEELKLARAAPHTKKAGETTPKPKYGVKVILTFASDGFEAAKAAASMLREKRDGLPRIGVLIFQEQLEVMAQDDQLFISSAFHQVDYIIPIITREYLKSIIDTEYYDDGAICVDAKYVRYIYTLLNTNFIKNGCLNKKCRCIIPDEILHSILRHPLLNSEPLFKVWKKLSETEELSRLLLRASLGKQKQANRSS